MNHFTMNNKQEYNGDSNHKTEETPTYAISLSVCHAYVALKLQKDLPIFRGRMDQHNNTT